MPSSTQEEENQILCFQDVLASYNNDNHENGDDDDDDVANVFFELANAPLVSYRLSGSKSTTAEEETTSIVIQQDVGACGQHTGGIVWETAYLLLHYLLATKHSCDTFLEVGAGCGLVGLGVHRSKTIATKVIVTETPPVMNNLLANIERNYPSKTKPLSLQAVPLDWKDYETDCAKAQIRPHSIDTIVGTDVVFSTTLVLPLLETLRYLSHKNTVIFLCLQERCKDSHRLLLETAKDHDLMVQDISDDVASLPTCEWGKDLECKVLKLTVRCNTEDKKNKRKRRKTEESG
jgi:predicted nicotinamide N-methyase